jgi:hypothetical protein
MGIEARGDVDVFTTRFQATITSYTFR